VIEPGTAVQYLKGVGPRRAAQLARLGVRTVADLLRHYPREHQDRREIAPISSLRPETHAVVRGRVRRVRTRELGGRRRPRSVVRVIVDDGTGPLEVEFWQQAYRARQLAPGTDVMLAGRVLWDHGPRMTGPEVETIPDDGDPDLLHAGRLVPVHPVTQGLHAATMRTWVRRALDEIADDVTECLPPCVLDDRGLMGIAGALRQAHFPDSAEALERALERLKYEEFFLLQLALAARRQRHLEEKKPHRVVVDERLDDRIRRRFPFQLTAAQDRTVAEIVADLAAPRPMNRLLQGDVGSGKTAVAAYAMLAIVARKLQAALLAPTEILAEQHYLTFTRILSGSAVRIGLLTGGARAAARREALRGAAEGELDIVVGTHALIQGDVRFQALALVVVDEQHKFGVLQRAALREKGLHPDMLVMSATPIPRTLTMTLFGDLDLSVIDELPPGRQPVETVLCAESDRAAAYDWVRREIARGRRAYLVVPLVEENEELPLKSAVEHAEQLRRHVFSDVGVGLLHGRLSSKEKDAAMQAFRSGETPLLVATSVVEVGVDVPEATALLVEHAERFGLAQLHQLRGRIGRGNHRSRMILFHDARTEDARARLDALAATTDGFRIAEQDLRIRGPGEFFGTRQHGLPELRLANLVGDAPLLAAARADAFALVEREPALDGEGAPAARELIARFAARRKD
jgi:ATP-dependent DNA helicase RecG